MFNFNDKKKFYLPLLFLVFVPLIVQAQQVTKVIKARYRQSNYKIPTGTKQVGFGDGLVGRFYEGTDFQDFRGERIARTMRFDWSEETPIEGLRKTHFTARYEGWLYVPETGSYTFYAYVDDGIRIWLDDQLLFDEWRGQYPTEFKRKFRVLGNRFYKVKIEYLQMTHTSFLQLSWKFEDEKKQIIGAEHLFTDLENTVVAPIVQNERASEVKEPSKADEVDRKKKNLPVAKNTTPKKRKPRNKQEKKQAPEHIDKPVVSASTESSAQPFAVNQPQKDVDADASNLKRFSQDKAERLKINDKLVLDDVYFEQGRAKLSMKSLPQLRKLVELMNKQERLKIMVVGHTDNVGDPKKNLMLSLERAKSVCIFLQSEGVAKQRLKFKGVGGTDPAVSNQTEKGRKLNRRVEFVVQAI